MQPHPNTKTQQCRAFHPRIHAHLDLVRRRVRSMANGLCGKQSMTTFILPSPLICVYSCYSLPGANFAYYVPKLQAAPDIPIFELQESKDIMKSTPYAQRPAPFSHAHNAIETPGESSSSALQPSPASLCPSSPPKTPPSMEHPPFATA